MQDPEAPGECSRLDISAGVFDPSQIQIDQVELEEEDVEDLSDEAVMGKLADGQYHAFVLSETGRPIFMSNGLEDQLCGLFALIGVFVSRVEHWEDSLQHISSDDVHIYFIHLKPIILCIVSRNEELLEDQLNVLFDQILSTLSRSQLETIYTKRGDNYDLRRLLRGTDKYMDSCLSSWRKDVSLLASSMRILPMAPSDRDFLSSTMASQIGAAKLDVLEMDNKGKLKKLKGVNNEDVIKNIIEENMDVRGGYKKESPYDTLAWHTLIFPYTLFNYGVWNVKWIIKNWIKQEDKLYLIRRNLGMAHSAFTFGASRVFRLSHLRRINSKFLYEGYLRRKKGAPKLTHLRRKKLEKPDLELKKHKPILCPVGYPDVYTFKDPYGDDLIELRTRCGLSPNAFRFFIKRIDSLYNDDRKWGGLIDPMSFIEFSGTDREYVELIEDNLPLEKDGILFLSFNRSTHVGDGSHICLAVYKAIDKHIVVYDSSNGTDINSYFVEQALNTMMYDRLILTRSCFLEKQKQSFSCAWHTIGNTLLVLNNMDPAKFTLSMPGLWQVFDTLLNSENPPCLSLMVRKFASVRHDIHHDYLTGYVYTHKGYRIKHCKKQFDLF